MSSTTRSGMTATGPTIVAITVVSGWDELRQEQSEGDRGGAGVGWCIGQFA